MPENLTTTEHRAGLVALCGRPNVGKSTLLNRLVGADLAVTTPRPQTTRQRMLGVWNGPGFQAGLVDTPGIHRPRSALNRWMVDEARHAASGVDVIMVLAEIPLLDPERMAEWAPGPGAIAALETVSDLGRPLMLVLTKVDRVSNFESILPVLAKWQSLFDFSALVPVSARTDFGLSELATALGKLLPEGPDLWDPETLSDRNLRWHAAELVRAEIFAQLEEELPYSCAVVIDSFRAERSRDRIEASIHVERASQRGVVIGNGGSRIRALGAASRARIAELTGRPCDLMLEVRVTADWTKDSGLVEKMGYRHEEA